jgi:hypothetical protein
MKAIPGCIQENQVWLVHLARFVAAGGLAGLGIAAKDYNVTGGTKRRPGS